MGVQVHKEGMALSGAQLKDGQLVLNIFVLVMLGNVLLLEGLDGDKPLACTLSCQQNLQVTHV